MRTSIAYAHITTKTSGKAIVEGTRVAVSDIAALTEEGLTAQQIQAQFAHLKLAEIHSALAYYYDHKAEIEAERSRAGEQAETIRLRFPDRVS